MNTAEAEFFLTAACHLISAEEVVFVRNDSSHLLFTILLVMVGDK